MAPHGTVRRKVPHWAADRARRLPEFKSVIDRIPTNRYLLDYVDTQKQHQSKTKLLRAALRVIHDRAMECVSAVPMPLGLVGKGQEL